MEHADVVVAGAGLIGASLALELAWRGFEVALLTEAEPLAHTSIAAAGMLAVDDPENPGALHALSIHSRKLYPTFLEHVARAAQLSEPVAFQTHETLQGWEPDDAVDLPALARAELHALEPGLRGGSSRFALLAEASLDPQELADAVVLALRRSPRIRLHTHRRVQEVVHRGDSVVVHSTAGPFAATEFVDCTGAWSVSAAGATTSAVAPRKGQILSVALPPELRLSRVVRVPGIYIVPRTHGPRAGEAVIGATVEDRGFDLSVETHAVSALRARAAQLLPALGPAPILRAWAGLRPATADGLPLLGRTGEHTFIAKGHFRNGILLAPATAATMADLITGQVPAVDLTPFSPQRGFSAADRASASNQPRRAAEHDRHPV